MVESTRTMGRICCREQSGEVGVGTADRSYKGDVDQIQC